MKHAIITAGAFCLALGSPTQAETLSDEKILVLACLEQMEDATTWNQCLNLMFQPCVGEDVGSDGHVTCLNEERTAWSKSVEVLQRDVGAAITAEGNTQLAEILGQWTGVIVQNCQDISLTKAATGQESARLGCEISEIVGLAGELAACLEGRSTAEYCTYKNK
jgi:hypothetical protein